MSDYEKFQELSKDLGVNQLKTVAALLVLLAEKKEKEEVKKVEQVKVWEPKGDHSLLLNVKNSFPSKKEAERAVCQLRIHSDLLAYRAEFNPDFTHLAEKANGYFVSFNHHLKKWQCHLGGHYHTPSIVYFSREVAEDLADKMNSGKVIL